MTELIAHEALYACLSDQCIIRGNQWNTDISAAVEQLLMDLEDKLPGEPAEILQIIHTIKEKSDDIIT